MKILVIDDDLDLLKLMDQALNKDYLITTCNDASKLDLNAFRHFDLIILDLMMPNMSGFEFLKAYRNHIDIPILVLTAKDFEQDLLEAFALGADDYITKPFSIKELRARIKAHIRREGRVKHNRLVDGVISMDLHSKQIFVQNEELIFTSSEYEILELLLRNKGQVFSKEQIYTSIYGFDGEGNSSTTITERVKLIRLKFSPYNINPIKTIWGVGYLWNIEKV